MDTQSLNVFMRVADLSSFSLAAEQLYLTQSAVSKRIQQLESQLNSPLFERHNRTISLTEAGITLYSKAQQILDLVSDTELTLQNLNGTVTGTLSMATSHHIGLHRLPPILKEFVRCYPDAQLNLEFMGSERAYKAVLSRQVELALTTLEYNPPDGIESSLIWLDDMVCVCSAEHTLAQTGAPSLKQLADTPAILPEPDTITFQLVEAAFVKKGLKLQTPMPTNYLETIKMMVSVGLGWSLLPESMVIHDQQLHRIRWPGPDIQRPLGLIHLQHRTLSNAATAFIERLKEEIPS